MRGEKADVTQQIAGVDRVPHHQVHTAVNDPAIGRYEAEAPAERQLAGDHQPQSGAGNHGGRHVGQQRRTVAGAKERGGRRRDERDEAGDKRSVDDLGAAAEDRHHHDEGFAHEQQQAGHMVRPAELGQEVDRQHDEQENNRAPREQVRHDVATRLQHVSAPLA
jgi:hypothetical protein